MEIQLIVYSENTFVNTVCLVGLVGKRVSEEVMHFMTLAATTGACFVLKDLSSLHVQQATVAVQTKNTETLIS